MITKNYVFTEVACSTTDPIDYPFFGLKVESPVYFGAALREQRPIEWRCDYCQSVNVLGAMECGKCGAPRPLLIQEMNNG